MVVVTQPLSAGLIIAYEATPTAVYDALPVSPMCA
jgi:hypothetical protein